MQSDLTVPDKEVKKQIAGGFLSPEWVLEPSRAEPYVRQCARAGFFAYLLFARQMKQTVLDEKVRTAVKTLAGIVHRHGLKFILDTDPTWWGEDLIQRYPETALWCIVPVQTRAYKGRIKTYVRGPEGARIVRFREISALYCLAGGRYEKVKEGEYDFKWQECGEPSLGLELEVKLKSSYDGPVRIYTAVSTTSLIDQAHPKYLEAQKSLLNMYADLPLDGLSWDEPGKGHASLTRFRAGEGFFALFFKIKGYDLRDKLIYLDCCDGTSEAVKVRCDYYGSLSEMHYRAQEEHNNYARQLWGGDIICGTHQTWSGLPLDLAAGVMDHFRLGKTLTSAWADGGVDAERKILAFPLMLADSLKKELGRRDSYYNDWSRLSQIEPFRFFNRFKTLFHVNTFTHTYSDHSEGLVNMRSGPLSEVYEADIRLQDSLDAMIGERLSDTDIALWYGWEGYAALPKWAARAVYTFMLNTSLLLTDMGLFGDFVSNEGILSGVVGVDRLNLRGNTYKVLIVPYAHAIPKEVYARLMEASQQGVKVVFVGPPPEFTDTGEKLDFCAAVGVEPVTFAGFEQVLKLKGIEIEPDESEPIYLDVTCPLNPVSAEAYYNIEQEIIAVKAPKRSLYWMPSLDPRQDLGRLIEPWCQPRVQVYSPNTYFRTFSARNDSHDFVLVLAPREGMSGWGMMPESLQAKEGRRPPVKPVKIKVLAKINNQELQVSGESWCALHFKNNEIVEYLTDDNVEIVFDGCQVKG